MVVEQLIDIGSPQEIQMIEFCQIDTIEALKVTQPFCEPGHILFEIRQIVCLKKVKKPWELWKHVNTTALANKFLIKLRLKLMLNKEIWYWTKHKDIAFYVTHASDFSPIGRGMSMFENPAVVHLVELIRT